MIEKLHIIKNKKNHIPRTALINDITGFSRCSAAVGIPILSSMGIQPCLLPTSILSNHTGYDEFFFYDFTEHMRDYFSYWKKLDIDFQAVYSGFLGSHEQIEIVSDIIMNYKKSSLILVDPVMGDNGSIYSTYTKQMCGDMKKLISHADIITPNVTESIILAGDKYKDEYLSDEKAHDLCLKLADMGPDIVMITGILSYDNCLKVACFDKTENRFFINKNKKVSVNYPGTGDMFASLICGYLLNRNSLESAVKKACDFIYKASDYTMRQGTPKIESIQYELFLKDI